MEHAKNILFATGELKRALAIVEGDSKKGATEEQKLNYIRGHVRESMALLKDFLKQTQPADARR